MNDDLISRSRLRKNMEFVCMGVMAGTEPYDAPLIEIDNAPPIKTTIEDLISTLSVEELKATTWFKVDTPSGDSVSFRREKTGHWIKEDEQNLCGWYRCSECGRRVEDLTDDIKIHAGCEDYTIADIYPYCHCGAKMRMEAKNND